MPPRGRRYKMLPCGLLGDETGKPWGKEEQAGRKTRRVIVCALGTWMFPDSIQGSLIGAEW